VVFEQPAEVPAILKAGSSQENLVYLMAGINAVETMLKFMHAVGANITKEQIEQMNTVDLNNTIVEWICLVDVHTFNENQLHCFQGSYNAPGVCKPQACTFDVHLQSHNHIAHNFPCFGVPAAA